MGSYCRYLFFLVFKTNCHSDDNIARSYLAHSPSADFVELCCHYPLPARKVTAQISPAYSICFSSCHLSACLPWTDLMGIIFDQSRKVPALSNWSNWHNIPFPFIISHCRNHQQCIGNLFYNYFGTDGQALISDPVINFDDFSSALRARSSRKKSDSI